jgi:hypothetical protein
MRFSLWPATESPPQGPVQIVQRAVADPSSIGVGNVATALQEIVQHELWRNANDASGAPFQSFGEFAVGKAPHGLAVRCFAAARLMRHALFEKRLFGPWTNILELIARKPGHQPTIVNEEDCVRYYTVSRALTSSDRILLNLKEHHFDVFTKMICEEGCSPYSAAVHAGLVVVAERSRLRFGVCDFEAAKRLRHDVQGTLLRELFRALSGDAQCELLARELTPSLGGDLARRWRERTK